ncbi:uncharacterized protein LOC117167023 [Belonocnema kinseyi]|uniref:uncharacterized protein LOC117167023 n=1 Tax=Belonocnema kinseyi TaxID=2817044 RepID=UPI00143DF1FB|nr:uncharacterized protein LOC117167023 [Belonocnema kinseyi]
MPTFYYWVKATRKLNFQQQEAKQQQNRSILDKYSNFMNSHEVMTDSENLENIDNHERRLDLDNAFLIDPQHYFETENCSYESSPQREKVARHKDNSESMDVYSGRISETRSLTQETLGVSTARSRSLPLESERTRPTKGLSAERNYTSWSKHDNAG